MNGCALEWICTFLKWYWDVISLRACVGAWVRACVRACVCVEQNHLAIYGKQWPYDVTPREDKTLPCGKLNAPVSSALTIVS